MANYLIYPCKTMNITQRHDGTDSHTPNSSGSPADYPIDDACDDTGRSWMYCPCDEMEVVRIYGVGGDGTNTIWLRSTSEVDIPCGSDYVVIMVIHPEDDDLENLYVGQTFSRGDAMFREGKDGYATGNHFHFAAGAGDRSGNGWAKNNKGAYVNMPHEIVHLNRPKWASLPLKLCTCSAAVVHIFLMLCNTTFIHIWNKV